RHRESRFHGSGRLKRVHGVEDVVLLHWIVVDVGVIGERQGAHAEAASHDRPVVKPIRGAYTWSKVLPIALHADALRYVAVSRDLQRVRRWVEVRQTALIDETDERRVVLVAQSGVDGQPVRHLPFVLNEGEERPETDARIGDL